MIERDDILTEKGLFERLIRLETKMDIMSERNRKTNFKFTWFAVLVVGIEFVNLLFNYVLYTGK